VKVELAFGFRRSRAHRLATVSGLVAIAASLGPPMPEALCRPRPNLERYELRCGDARVPLVEIWKSCKGLQAPGAADVDMPFTEAERRRASGGASASSCEVVEIATPTAGRPEAPGDAGSKTTEQLSELAQLLRAGMFSSTVAESERGCLTTEAAAFKKLAARRRPELFAKLAREATPAGRLYGLCGLRRRDKSLYRVLKSDVARSLRTVVLLDGCTPRPLALGEALAPLASPRRRSQFDTACDALEAAVVGGGADCGA
jgi:hypothetical protein